MASRRSYSLCQDWNTARLDEAAEPRVARQIASGDGQTQSKATQRGDSAVTPVAGGRLHTNSLAVVKRRRTAARAIRIQLAPLECGEREVENKRARKSEALQCPSCSPRLTVISANERLGIL